MINKGWLLLTYKLPSEPSKKRVGVWRKLKSLGAVYLQNGICLLPKTESHVRQLKLLEHEIAEMDGECVLLETAALDRAQEQKVISRFRADRNEAYQEFLGRCADFEAEIAKETANKHFTYAELEENDVDLKKLQVWLGKIRGLDFYGAALADAAQAGFEKCQLLLETYAQQVYEAAHEEHPGD